MADRRPVIRRTAGHGCGPLPPGRPSHTYRHPARRNHCGRCATREPASTPASVRHKRQVVGILSRAKPGVRVPPEVVDALDPGLAHPGSMRCVALSTN